MRLACRSSCRSPWSRSPVSTRSEEHTSELQSHLNLVCRLLLEKKNNYSRREADQHVACWLKLDSGDIEVEKPAVLGRRTRHDTLPAAIAVATKSRRGVDSAITR